MAVKKHLISKENVLLIRIKTISDALEYLHMKKVSSETKVIVIVRNSAFLKFLLKQKSCDLTVYCAKEKIHKVYQGIVYILDSTTIIDVTAEELFQECDCNSVYCEYCEPTMEQIEGDDFPREDVERNKEVCLVYAMGDIGLLEVNHACACLDKSRDVTFGCGYIEDTPMKVLSFWKR